jgi:hypothetical protein
MRHKGDCNIPATILVMSDATRLLYPLRRTLPRPSPTKELRIIADSFKNSTSYSTQALPSDALPLSTDA